MLFVVRFTDKTGSQTIREKYIDAHVAWLDARRESVLVAGSLREEPGSDPVGAFWVVEAKSKSTGGWFANVSIHSNHVINVLSNSLCLNL